MLRQMAALLRTEEGGATAIEYALIAALIAVVTIGSLTLLGRQVSTTYDQLAASADPFSGGGGAGPGGGGGASAGGGFGGGGASGGGSGGAGGFF
jgi:Flp pilus assembly pilin Flp